MLNTAVNKTYYSKIPCSNKFRQAEYEINWMRYILQEAYKLYNICYLS